MFLTIAFFKNDNKISITTKINPITDEVIELTPEEIEKLEQSNFQNNLIYVKIEINSLIDQTEYENTYFENDLVKSKLQLLKDYYQIEDLTEFEKYFTFRYLNFE